LLWPWQQQQQQQGRGQGHSKLPRSSWQHRKEIEEAGQLEVGSVMSGQGFWVSAASFKQFLMSLTGRWPQTVLCIKQQLHAVLQALNFRVASYVHACGYGALFRSMECCPQHDRLY
jgi:hypothetical protein